MIRCRMIAYIIEFELQLR